MRFRLLKSTRFWAAVIAAVFLLAAGTALFLHLSRHSGMTAVILLDGAEYKRIDLSSVHEPYDLEITTEYGSNTVHVEQGSISVIYADCPDKICVQTGAISSSYFPIACLPHHLVIEISDP